MNGNEVHFKINDQRNWAISRCNSIIDKTINREILRDNLVDLMFQMRTLNVNVMRDLLNEN
jgi:hypothetical protein